MDRFIDPDELASKYLIWNLKSNMDRFIDKKQTYH